MPLAHAFDNFWQYWRTKWDHFGSQLSQALVSDSDLKHIQQTALTDSTPLLVAEREVQHLLLGERTSAFAGSGYEFAENRRYVSGDDARFINWRLLARTGKLYRKIFHEERRPQVWLIVDRRNAMRFGTRKRLKITQGVIYALLQLFRAQQQQMATACVLLDKKAHWYPPGRSDRALTPAIDHLISAAPPLAADSVEVTLDHVIRQLNIQLRPGCIVYIVSDYHDLAPSSMASLHTLSQRHTVHACHIIDPIEQALPQTGHYRVQGKTDSPVTTLDCTNTAFCEQYEHAMQQRLAHIEHNLSHSGVHYEQLMTTTDLVELESNAPNAKQHD